MSTPLTEWEDLEGVWRQEEQPVDLAPLRRLLAAQRRRLVAVVTVEAVLVLAFGWLSWLVARDGVEAWEAVWLLTLWGFTVAAVAFAWWNRRGTWRSLGESVEEYLRLARLRARRARRSLAFACGLLVAEVVAGWCWLAARRIRQELALLDELSR